MHPKQQIKNIVKKLTDEDDEILKQAKQEVEKIILNNRV